MPTTDRPGGLMSTYMPARALEELELPPLEPTVGRAVFGAIRLDSQSFCARVTAPRDRGVGLPLGFAFRLTLSRSADASAVDVAVNEWLEVAIVDRTTTGDRLPPRAGELARIEPGEIWTYDLRLETRLSGGQGRTMHFAEAPAGRGWTVSFAEIDTYGDADPVGPVLSF
jgi:hypothetical protein